MEEIMTEEELEESIRELRRLSNEIILVLRKIQEGSAHLYKYDEAVCRYENYKNQLFRKLEK